MRRLAAQLQGDRLVLLSDSLDATAAGPSAAPRPGREIGPVIVLCLAVLVVFKGFASGALPAGPRTLTETWPRAVQLARLAHDGDALELDPASFLGEALSDRPRAQAFYPPARALLASLPPERALGALLLAHLLALVVGTYACARTFTLGRPAALLTALAFGFSGPVVARLDDLAGLSTLAYLPLVLALARWNAALPLLGLAALAGDGQLACVVGIAWAVARLAWAPPERHLRTGCAIAAGLLGTAALILAVGGIASSPAPVALSLRLGWVPLALVLCVRTGTGTAWRFATLAALCALALAWGNAACLAAFGLSLWAGAALETVLAWDPAGEADLELRAGPRHVTAALAVWLVFGAVIPATTRAPAMAFTGLWATSVALSVLGLLHRWRDERVQRPVLATALIAIAFLDGGPTFAARAWGTVRVPAVIEPHDDHPAKTPEGPLHFLVHAPGLDGVEVQLNRRDLNVFRGAYGHLLDGVTTVGGPADDVPPELVRLFGHWPPEPVADAALLRAAGVAYAASTVPLTSPDWVRFARSEVAGREFYIYRMVPPPPPGTLMREISPLARVGAAALPALRGRTGAVVLALPEPMIATPGARAGESVTATGRIYSVRAAAPGWLVMPHRFDRRWQLTVDGRAVELSEASGLTATRVDPGAHTIALTFDDPAARRALWAGRACVVWLTLALATALVRRR